MKNPLLWLLPSRFVGGPERQSLLAARTLRDVHGVDSFFLVMPSGNRAGVLNPFLTAAAKEGFRADEFVHAGHYDVFSARRAFRVRAEANAPRAILSLGYKANFLTADFPGIPTISYIHGFTGADLKLRAFEWLQRRFLLSRHSAVAVITRAQEESLATLGSKVFRVPNAWDPAREPAWLSRTELRREWNFSDSDQVLGCVGRLSEEKGQRFLLSSFVKLRAEQTNLRLVLVGDGPDRASLERLARESGVEHSVRFLGFQSGAAQLMKGFDALVLPSRTEGLPEVIFEAFAAGVPVVAARVGGVPEQLGEEDQNGWGFEPSDFVSLNVAVQNVFTSDSSEKCRAARWSLAAEWSPMRQSDALLHMLSST